MVTWDINMEGAWRATWLESGYLRSHVFYGYTKREAMRMLVSIRKKKG